MIVALGATHWKFVARRPCTRRETGARAGGIRTFICTDNTVYTLAPRGCLTLFVFCSSCLLSEPSDVHRVVSGLQPRLWFGRVGMQPDSPASSPALHLREPGRQRHLRRGVQRSLEPDHPLRWRQLHGKEVQRKTHGSPEVEAVS